ncbi:MAG TPA: ribbon-helix-helix domain-containing protein, partial [Gemmatimonadaceae bacterium]|nr:ribbon-helix-helix domain-containing protein [Gemmatimonadaceae bacterium]
MADAPPLARISMTIPPDALRRADRLAKRAGRSRSWVLTEAVRRLELPSAVAADSAGPTDSRDGTGASRSERPRLDP